MLDEPRQVSVTPLPGGGPGGRDPRRRASAAARDDHPLDAAHRGLGTASCGPDTLPEYLVGPGTYRWAWTIEPLGERLTMPIEVDASGAPVPPPKRPAQLRRPGPRQRRRRPALPRLARWRPIGRTSTSSRRPSMGSTTGSGTRWRSSTRRPAAAIFECPRSPSSIRTARRSSSWPYVAHRIESPGSRRSRACPRPTSRPTTKPTRSSSTLPTARAA